MFLCLPLQPLACLMGMVTTNKDQTKPWASGVAQIGQSALWMEVGTYCLPAEVVCGTREGSQRECDWTHRNSAATIRF